MSSKSLAVTKPFDWSTVEDGQIAVFGAITKPVVSCSLAETGALSAPTWTVRERNTLVKVAPLPIRTLVRTDHPGVSEKPPEVASTVHSTSVITSNLPAGTINGSDACVPSGDTRNRALSLKDAL
jgi:hypothetical protein